SSSLRYASEPPITVRADGEARRGRPSREAMLSRNRSRSMTSFPLAPSPLRRSGALIGRGARLARSHSLEQADGRLMNLVADHEADRIAIAPAACGHDGRD